MSNFHEHCGLLYDENCCGKIEDKPNSEMNEVHSQPSTVAKMSESRVVPIEEAIKNMMRSGTDERQQALNRKSSSESTPTKSVTADAEKPKSDISQDSEPELFFELLQKQISEKSSEAKECEFKNLLLWRLPERPDGRKGLLRRRTPSPRPSSESTSTIGSADSATKEGEVVLDSSNNGSEIQKLQSLGHESLYEGDGMPREYKIKNNDNLDNGISAISSFLEKTAAFLCRTPQETPIQVKSESALQDVNQSIVSSDSYGLQKSDRIRLDFDSASALSFRPSYRSSAGSQRSVKTVQELFRINREQNLLREEIRKTKQALMEAKQKKAENRKIAGCSFDRPSVSTESEDQKSLQTTSEKSLKSEKVSRTCEVGTFKDNSSQTDALGEKLAHQITSQIILPIFEKVHQRAVIQSNFTMELSEDIETMSGKILEACCNLENKIV